MSDWRTALEIMGYEIDEDETGWEYVSKDESPDFWRPVGLDDPWQLFGLAVEWIEARGGLTSHGRLREADPQWFNVQLSTKEDDTPFLEQLYSEAPTLPDAAARWIVEHGGKLEKERDNG